VDSWVAAIKLDLVLVNSKDFGKRQEARPHGYASRLSIPP
jgi:hypothetical protein